MNLQEEENLVFQKNNTVAGMLLANLSSDTQIIKQMCKIQQNFKDCLQPLQQQCID